MHSLVTRLEDPAAGWIGKPCSPKCPRRERFEGEHPCHSWSQSMETPCAGYAPSNNRVKQWPQEAQIEGWLSFSSFLIAADGLHPSGWLGSVVPEQHAFAHPPGDSVDEPRQVGVGTPDARKSGVQDRFVLTSPSIEGMTGERAFRRFSVPMRF